MRSLVGLADLARIVARLPRDDARELAHALGFEAFGPVAPPAAVRPREHAKATPEATFAAAVATMEARAAAPERPPAAFWRVERYEPASDDAHPPPAGEVFTDPLAPGEPRGGLFDTPEAPPLTPWRQLWPTLQEALRTELPGRDPDVAALVRRWSRGEPVARIPQVRRRAWAARASLWLDYSPHLIPLWTDMRRVEQGLRRVFRRALQVRGLGREAAHRASGSPRGWLHGYRADAATPVVVLGDLGALGGADAGRWRHAVKALAAQGVRVTAVVPWAPRRHRARSLRGARMVAWEHARAVHTTVGLGDDAAAGEEVGRLLEMVSTACLVQPGLLRELRWLLPTASVEAELAVWNHALVEAADDSVLVLRRDALETLRRAFLARGAAWQRAAGAVLQRWRARLLRELTHAETLAWCEGGGDAAAAPSDVAEARAFLARLDAMLTAGTAEDGEAWVHYGRELHAGMPASACARNPALARVWEVAYEGVDGAVAPEGVDVAALRAQRKGRRQVQAWALRQVGDALVATPRAETRWPSDETGAGSPVAVLEAAGAELWVEAGGARTQHVLRARSRVALDAGASVALRGARGTLHARPWVREPWASAAGRDAYGLWAEVTVEGVAFRMRWVPPGCFTMGSPEGEAGRVGDDEFGGRYSERAHEVVLTKGYWLGETPVTQALWVAVMGTNPSGFQSADRPVETVNWEECVQWIERANGRVPSLALRLPTQAEWEHACRGGTTTATWVGELEIVGECNAPALDEIAWYGGNSGKDFDLPDGVDSSGWPNKQYPHTSAGTRTVGQKAANPLGLYDMLGNVWEWCSDWLAPYDLRLLEDPTGPTSGAKRVLRGGSWGTQARHVRAASRYAYDPGYRGDDFGFRLARGPSALP